MVSRPYVPQRGDLVWMSFDPQAGHEQAGRRPALVLTPASYNQKSGLAIVAPVTSRVKGYPFDVPLSPGLPVAGVVQADQLRSLDWSARRAELICPAPREVLEEALTRTAALLEVRPGNFVNEVPPA